MIVGFEDEPTDDFENLEGNTAIEENNEPTIEFAVPVAGEVFPISKVKDQAFASEAMGKGVGIIPAMEKSMHHLMERLLHCIHQVI